MTLVKELREKAALCRRAARVPTNGGRAVDRILIELAEQLDHQAEAVNRPQMRQESVIFNSRKSTDYGQGVFAPSKAVKAPGLRRNHGK